MSDDDLAAAKAGDRAAFDRLVAPHLGRLRAVGIRMLGHPDEAADVVQETLLSAFRQLATFRGDASFSTWLVRIATHESIDVLRRRGRWRLDAQLLSKNDCVDETSALHGDLNAAVAEPGFVYDVREHIAFCFTCIARSLDPEVEASLVLCDVLDLTNREAADVLGISESVHRHRLSAARAHMQNAFDGLCALVSKTGACHQCSELRDGAREDRRGPDVPDLASPPPERWRRRLAIVKEADPSGRSAALHELLFRWIATYGRAEP